MEYSKLCARLPIGISDFENLRGSGAVYVDKTRAIYDLVSKNGRYLLTRPRRFGKSLLLSAIASLFEHGLKDFHGLAIESLWSEEKPCRVIRLDFSLVRNFLSAEDFRLKLEIHLSAQFSRAGFTCAPNPAASLMAQLSSWMESQPAGSCVLLIDEYDAPLTACLDNPALFSAVRKNLQDFYAAVKARDKLWRLVFITGIANFSQTGIFSEFNRLSAISLAQGTAALLGFTREEIRTFFPEFVGCSAKALGLSEESLLDRLGENYDGYCFDGFDGNPDRTPVRVHAPWSVLNFFEQPYDGFKNYWIQSGGKITLLRQYLKDHALCDPKEYGKEMFVEVSALQGSSDFPTVSDIALLTQAGYFTIKRREMTEFVVGYPNREVANSMASLCLKSLLAGRSFSEAGLPGLMRALMTGDAKSAMAKLNQAFASISCQNYPVTDEAACRACALVFFCGAGISAQCETQNMLGRSDLEFDAGDWHWVFEFKFLKAGEEKRAATSALLEKARAQIIERQYGAASGKKLVRVAAVFSEERRQFEAFAPAA